jgi:hypothetical protein
MDVAQYNPDKDSDGSGAKKLVDLLVEALTARLQAIPESEKTTTGTDTASPGASSTVPATADAGPLAVTSPDASSEVAQATDATPQQNSQDAAPDSEESSSGMSAHESSA